jgi:hypothetical protein
MRKTSSFLCPGPCIRARIRGKLLAIPDATVNMAIGAQQSGSAGAASQKETGHPKLACWSTFSLSHFFFLVSHNRASRVEEKQQ